MDTPEKSSGLDQIYSLLNSISARISDLPGTLRDQVEADLLHIRLCVADGAHTASDDSYKELAESINDGFVELDREWRFTYVNQRAASNVGYTPAELIGLNMWEKFPSLLGTPAEQAYRQVMEQRQTASFETAGTITDKWYNIRVYPSARGITIFWIDVTKQKQTDALLRESEQRFSLIFQKAPVGMSLSKLPDGVLVDVNEAWENCFGYTKQEAVGKTSLDLGINPDPETRNRSIADFQTNGFVRDREMVLYTKKVEQRVFLVNIDTINIGGSPHILNTVLDITGRKQVEEALRREYERAAWLARFPDKNPDPVARVTTDGTIIYHNPASAENGDWAFMDGKQVPEPVLSLLQQAAASGKKVSQDVRLGERYYAITVMPFPDEQYANLYGLDITERKQAEEQLRQSERRLQDFLDSNQESFVMLDRDWRIRFINRRGAEILGTNPEAIIGKVYWDMFPLYIGSTLEQNFRRAMKERVSVQFQMGGLYSPYWYDLNVCPTQEGIASFAIDRTAEKTAREELQSAYTRLRFYVDANIIGVVIAKDDGTLIEVNDNYLNILGYTRTEFEAGLVDWRNITPPEQLPVDERAIAELIEHGRCTPYEKEYYRKDGSRVWVYISAALLPDGTIAAYVLDISKRKRAELELRQSEAKYRNLFENMAEEVHFWRLVRDADGNIQTWRLVDANPPTLKSWGWTTLAEIQGKTTDEIFGPGAAEHYMPVVQKVMASGVPDSYEDYFPNLDKYFRFTTVPLGDYFITTGADITEIKKTSQAIIESAARLNRSQEVAHLGSWELNIGNNELTWSDEVYRIFGLQPGDSPVEFGATYEAFLDHVHPEDRQAVDEAYTDSIRDGRDSYEIEHRVIRQHSGEIRIVHEKCEHIRDEQGKIIRSIGMVHDITERKRAEEAEREHLMQMEIQRKLLGYRDQERQALALDLHDGPVQDLSSLLFNVQFAKAAISDLSIQLELEKIAAGIRTSVQNMRQMINEMRPPSLIRFGLAKAVNVFLEEFREKHPEIEFHVSLTDDENCLSEPARLSLFRIMQEALTNAVKHSQSARIDVTLLCGDDQVALEIQDDGDGFEFSGNLIDYSTNGHFGLVGMKERADAIGAEFQVYSSPEKGTTIKVIVPVNKQ